MIDLEAMHHHRHRGPIEEAETQPVRELDIPQAEETTSGQESDQRGGRPLELRIVRPLLVLLRLGPLADPRDPRG